MRNWLEYIPFILTAQLVRGLPRRMALHLGRRLATLGRWIQPRRVTLARSNLQQAFPEKSPAEIDVILHQMYGHLGASFAEMLRLDRISPADLRDHYTLIGKEHLDAALACGRGGILLTGHLGFWEAGNVIFSRHGYPIAVVAKPMRNPLVDRYFRRMREAGGSYLIDSHKGARRILKALQSNHLVGVLMDQHAGKRQGIAVPFFGRPAWTTPIIAEMAMKYRVPVIPAFARRTADDCHQVIVEPHFFLEGSGSEAVRTNVARLNLIIEEAVRRNPSQWFWVHRRWRG